MAAEPHLVAAVDPELARAARELARRIGAAERPRELRREGAEMVLRLTEAGLAAFYLRPVETLGLGALANGTVAVGLRSAQAGIGLFVRRLVDGLDDEQLRGMASAIEHLLVDLEEG
ncbi:MAG TPA: hypothetical protein VLA75_10585 [Thermoanaerobaculia bacterium]|nr:hypothetical protein [Thermoanaerobaculia bacterium]